MIDHRHYGILAILFGFLSIAYLIWTWSDMLGGLGGDNAVYLLTARHYSPWSASSSVVEYFVARSLFPPLYPLLLALLGGGESVVAAHVITTSFLLAAFALLYVWMRMLGLTWLMAASLTLLFAALPGTYVQALAILSENLFLALTLAALVAVARAERVPDQRKWLWIAAALIAAATLTRNAGITLAAAFALYLVLQRPRHDWPLALVAIAPMLLWTMFNYREDLGYVSAFGAKYDMNSLVALFDQMMKQAKAVWVGWVLNFSTSPVGIPVMTVLGVLALAGTGCRVYQRTLDGFYVAAYLLLIFAWPFPAESMRLIYVIVPVMLVQMILLFSMLPQIKLGHFSIRAAYGVPLIVMLVALPNLALTLNRYLLPLPEELAPYRHSASWYEWHQDALQLIGAEKGLVDALRGLPKIVPEEACVYNIKPSLVGFYGKRLAKTPPRPHLDDAAFRAALLNDGCRYLLMIRFESPSYPDIFYPAERMGDSLQILTITPDFNFIPVAMLAVWKENQ